MSETVKIWLNDLFEREIKESEGTIENEKLWKLGSSTQEEQDMHQSNINEHFEYIEILKELKAQIS